MDYRKLIEAYKNGTLDEQQSGQVSADIEKHEAISDYLMENAEIPELDELSLAGGDSLTQSEETSDGASSDLAGEINRYIRRAFAKAGVIVGTAVLGLTLAVLFLLPRFVDCFYYNPCEVAGANERGIESNRISLDMAVYTELHLPSGYRDYVNCEREGYGSYSIYIPENYSYGNNYTDVAGKLTRNKLTLYNPNVFKKDAEIAFSRVAGIYDDESDWSLPSDNRLYRAYVSFDKVMSYGQLVQWCDANPAYSPEWCYMCYNTVGYGVATYGLGFIYNFGCTEMGFDSAKYPLLTPFSLYEKNNVGETFHIPEEDMKQHVCSLLRYSEDHREFPSMMNWNQPEGWYTDLADNIEQNGIFVCGFTVVGSGDEIRGLAKAENISGIYVEPLS